MITERITLPAYWMGRDTKYPRELTYEIISNAKVTVERANTLLQHFADDTGIEIAGIASGWRPVGVNAATANAAAGSRHITAEAIDLRDTAHRDLARWSLLHLDLLEDVGMWMEDPQWTPTWVHWQIQPPGSRHRVYVPSSKPAIVAKLVEQGGAA